MQKHVRIYLNYFNIGEQDIIRCELCGKQGRADGGGFDIHHIEGRGKGKDEITNLILLCRKCHEKAHKIELTRKELILIHNYTLTGMSKRDFLK
jgi:5-methylcytosine-specific restriction endonuclease McrA